MSTKNTAVGGRIRGAREILGLTQDDAAILLGCSRSNISLLESGAVALSAADAAVLAVGLRVSLDWLIRGTGRGPTRPAAEGNEPSPPGSDIPRPAAGGA